MNPLSKQEKRISDLETKITSITKEIRKHQDYIKMFDTVVDKLILNKLIPKKLTVKWVDRTGEDDEVYV